MNTVMTKDDVFEAVLEKYETSETSVIWEYSGNIEGDIEELSQEIKELRERYYTAEPTLATDTNVVCNADCKTCKHYEKQLELPFYFCENCQAEGGSHYESYISKE